jgi:hypothetical protein
VHHAEDQGVCSYSQRQRDNHYRRKTGVPADYPGAVAEVSKTLFENRETSSIPAFLLRLIHAAELHQCHTTRLCRAHTATEIVLDVHLKVAVEFFCQITFEPLFIRQVA